MQLSLGALLFHCAYYPIAVEETDAEWHFPDRQWNDPGEKCPPPGMQTEKTTQKALGKHKRKAWGRFQCAPEVQMDIFMGTRKKNRMKELK